MGHGHGHSAGRDRRRLAAALVVTLVTAVVGAVGAALTGSLALLADLGHLLTDAGALFAAFIATVLAVRPRTARRTYGFGRVEVLVAGLNALALLAVVVWVAIESIQRLSDPAEVPGLPMLVIGALGLLGNVVSLIILNGGDRRNMNMRGAAMHVRDLLERSMPIGPSGRSTSHHRDRAPVGAAPARGPPFTGRRSRHRGPDRTLPGPRAFST